MNFIILYFIKCSKIETEIHLNKINNNETLIIEIGRVHSELFVRKSQASQS